MALSRRATVRLTVILGILSAFGPLSIDMYLPGFPAIAATYEVDASAVQQTLAVFFIGMAVGQLLYGPITDRIGRRAPLLFGGVLYAVAAVCCAVAPSIGALTAFRFVQALGGCAGMMISRSVVRDLFDAHESARMYSFLTLVMGVAPILAPVIGAQLLVFASWRAIFWVLAAFGLLCTLMVATSLPETLPPERRTAAGLGVALRNYGLLLSDRSFLGLALAISLSSGGMFAYIAASPFVFIDYYGVSAQQYSVIFGMNAFGIIGASQVNRWLLGRYRAPTILRAALMVAATAGAVLLLMAATRTAGFVGVLVPLFCCIASIGLVGSNAMALALANHGRLAGSGSALIGTIQFGLSALVSSLVGVLHNGTAVPMAAIIAGCNLLALLIVLLALRQQAARPALQPLEP